MHPQTDPLPRALARADRDAAVDRAVALITAAFPGTIVDQDNDDADQVTS